jgi:hypothetical protein
MRTPSSRARCNVALLALLALCPLAPRARSQATDPFVVTVPLPDGAAVDLTFETDPALADCRPVPGDDRRLAWECSNASLDVSIRAEVKVFMIDFALRSRSGEPLVLRRYGARVLWKYTDGDGIWSYNHLPWRGMRNTTPIEHPFEADTSPNRGIPFAVMVDSEGNNRFALGLVHQDRLAELRGALDPTASAYALALTQVEAAAASRHSDTFYFSRASESWYAVAQDYTREVDRARNYVPLPIPASAYNPTYDPWYWTFDNLNEGLVWDLAKRSSALGFKAYMLDAGWDVPQGQYQLFLDGSTGDYDPPAETFPDFRGLLDRIRGQLDMKVILWMQQYTLGRRSRYYPELSYSLAYAANAETGEMEETPALCPRVAGTGRHFERLFARIFEDYRPDALWFDWQENIPVRCGAVHRHEWESLGEGYTFDQDLIVRTVLAQNPDVFIDMRWPFANLYNKPYTHLWQPFDTPNDFETMRLQAMAMRPFSAGVLMGTDEMYWPPHLPDTEAARFMATVVFTGIPYFGQNLLQEPESRVPLMKAWLNFYQRHRGELTGGAFRPYGDQNQPDQIIEGRNETFIYYGHPSGTTLALREKNERTYIVNVSETPALDLSLSGLAPGNYLVSISDPLLQPSEGTSVQLESNTRLKYDVPVGCLLILKRVHKKAL